MYNSNFWAGLASQINANGRERARLKNENTNNVFNGLNNAFKLYLDGATREDDLARADAEKQEGIDNLNKQRVAAANWLKSQNVDGLNYTNEVEQAIMTSDDPMGLAKEIYAEKQGRNDKQYDSDKAALETIMAQNLGVMNSAMVSNGEMMSQSQKDTFEDAREKYLRARAVYENKYTKAAFEEFEAKLKAEEEAAKNQSNSVDLSSLNDEEKLALFEDEETPKEVNQMTGKPIEEQPQNVVDWNDAKTFVKDEAYTYEDLKEIFDNASPEVLNDFFILLNNQVTNNADSILKNDKAKSLLVGKMRGIPKKTRDDLMQEFPRLAAMLPADFKTDFEIAQVGKQNKIDKGRAKVKASQEFADGQKDRKKKQEEEAKTTDETTKLNVAKSKLQELLRSTQKISRFKAPDGIDVDAWKKICNENSDEIILHNKYLK